MAARNPALNDKIFQQEIEASRSGPLSPAWGSPADEVPNDLFDQRGRPSTLPPPPPRGDLGQQPYPASAPPSAPPYLGEAETMRLSGTLSATAILFGFLLVAGYFGWQAVEVVTFTAIDGSRQIETIDFPAWLYGGIIVGLVLAIVTCMKPRIARFTAPAYAVAQGLFVGGITHVFEGMFPGIAAQAVGLTVGVFTMMLVLYASGTIRVTDKLRKGIIAATGAVLIVYLVSWVMRLLFDADVPMIHESGTAGILFSLVVVGIAAFNLLLDFDFIERGVQARAPRHLEWFGAFGLLVSLVWLYVELLRLLAKLRNN